MHALLLLVVGILMLTNAPIPAVAAETAVEMSGDGTPSQGPKLPGNNSDELKAFPDANESTEVGPGSTPEAVFRSGCIFRPGQTVTISLNARNRVLYRVVPSRFFDVTMRVNYVGLRSFPVDRFFAGGAESILIQGPARFWPVKVTIAGFRGSTGCFAFSATP